jgi:hypothetical protein
MSSSIGNGAAAVAIERSPTPEQDAELDEGTRDFDKEIEDYIASDNWLPDIYTASTPVSGHEQIVIDRLWEEVAAEATDGQTHGSDFEETFASGFISAKLAMQAAKDYTRFKLSWSKTPPQSKVDLNVVGRIQGEDQKYQRLIGKCSVKDCKCKVVFRLSDGIDGGYAMYKIDSAYEYSHNHAVSSYCPDYHKVVNGYVMVERMDQLQRYLPIGKLASLFLLLLAPSESKED